MYCPKTYAVPTAEDGGLSDVMQTCLAENPLAMIVWATETGITADHIPLLYNKERKVLEGHVARANPFWQAANGQRVLVVFRGPQGYISPSWYPSKWVHHKHVPTWNYALVHIEGKVTSVDNDKDGLRAFLETLVDTQETRTAESYPEHQAWRIDDAPPEYIAAQMRAIVKVEISVDSVFAKFKMSQNREPEDAQAVVRNLLCAGGDQSEELAALVGQCNKLDTASLLRHSGLRGRISVSAGLVHVGVGFAAGMCAAWWLLRK